MRIFIILVFLLLSSIFKFICARFNVRVILIFCRVWAEPMETVLLVRILRSVVCVLLTFLVSVLPLAEPFFDRYIAVVHSSSLL